MARITCMKGVAALSASLLVGAAAFAQCTISGAPDFIQNDGGCPVAGVTDTNGGCNVTPVSFQATGTITGSNSFTINGTCGQDPVAGSRDIDWYSFTVTAPCFVNISANMTDPAGVASTSTIMFFGNAADCNSIFGYLFTTCPAAFPEQYISTPGTYAAIITTDFSAGGGLVCNSPYTLTVSSRTSTFAQCGNPSSGTCGVPTPGIGGCQDIVCCDRVCTANPLCCDIEWDASCSTLAQATPAAGGCGVFVYSCPAATGAPANNCATASEVVALNTATAFDNTFATTDGPNNGQCGSDTLKDVWFAVQANADGNLTMFSTSPTQDVVLSAYDYGTTGAPFDGTQLANNFVGCVDINGIGGENGTIVGALANHWYLWRIGIWGNPQTPGTEGVAGAGTVEFRLEQVAYFSGNHAPVCDATGAGVNLGLSSGPISATQPQRWLAAPFTVSDPAGAPNSWRATFFVPEGFQPAGTTNTNLNWILWRRTGNNAPNYAVDQLASGQIAYPALGGNGEAYIPVDLTLNPGDYAFTVFASAPGNPCRASDAQAIFSNFAWFIGAPAGVFLQDATGIFAWRSNVQPGSGPADEVVVAGTTTPCEGNPAAGIGFLRYTALTGVYSNCTAGGSLGPVYTPALQVLGIPQAPACPADINGDGSVNGGDLTTLLSSWGGTGSADINNDGVVNGGDLTILLSSWGACP